ncbi:MAG: DHH family phosphoesterase, partial [Cyanobacteria bacterium]|nr:DHH family phosphoesterase [Cyanobacteriota bacterium]
MKNVWQYRGQNHRDEAIQPDFLEAVGGSPLVARLLLNRGITTPKSAKAFLDLENYQPSSGYDLPDMELGVRRIVQALDNEENILIFGDFDVDGITGTSVLYETLKRLNAKVSYYIPDRATEGHGLNVAALCRLVSTRQLKLVISTDTGITNYNEVSLLKGLKVDTIITDHHDLPENLPPSVANINPKLLPDQSHPLALLAGVGVAFKLCELLLEVRGYPPEQAEALLDLVAVGTIADLVPLIRENRYLAYRGIQVLNKHQRLGINQIIEQAVGKTDNIPKPDIIVSSETV